MIAEIKTPMFVTCSVLVMNLDNVIRGLGSRLDSCGGSHFNWIK